MYAKEARDIAYNPELEKTFVLIREAALLGKLLIPFNFNVEVMDELIARGYEVDTDDAGEGDWLISWAK